MTKEQSGFLTFAHQRIYSVRDYDQSKSRKLFSETWKFVSSSHSGKHA